jgi:hypothetical protein
VVRCPLVAFVCDESGAEGAEIRPDMLICLARRGLPENDENILSAVEDERVHEVGEEVVVGSCGHELCQRLRSGKVVKQTLQGAPFCICPSDARSARMEINLTYSSVIDSARDSFTDPDGQALANLTVL